MSSVSKQEQKQPVCAEHPKAPVLRDFIPNAIVCALCGKCVGKQIPENANNVAQSSAEAIYHKSLKSQLRMHRILAENFREIALLSQRINVPYNIEHRAVYIFKEIMKCYSLRRYSCGSKALVSLYIACRQECVPRTLKEMCAVGSVARRDINVCLKAVRRVLDIKLDSLSAADFIARFSSRLSLPKDVEKAATIIATKAVEMELVSGRSPISITAASIYMATKASTHKRSQKIIHEITGVADSTVRRIYRVMSPHAQELFPANSFTNGSEDEQPEIHVDPNTTDDDDDCDDKM